MKSSSYFDNAATTYPKPDSVYSEADQAFRSLGGSIGRSDGQQSKTAAALAQRSKDSLKTLLGAEGKEVVFTSSATDALNRILQGLDLAHATVYVSPFEHNAVTRTLHHLALKSNVNVRLLPFDKDTLLLNEHDMLEAFSLHKPDLVVMTHASNVCGAVLPVETICEAAKGYDAITVVDMSQTAGLVPLRLNLGAIDFAVFAGHKTLLAPFGVGGFICSPSEDRLRPVFFGGNGVDSINQEMPRDLVHMEEIGSQNTYAIAGLLASTKWLAEHEDAAQMEAKHSERLLQLLSNHANITVIAKDMLCPRIGVVSCLFDGFTPDEIGSVLSDQGISVRTGLHCSPYAHTFLGTIPLGTVRFSVSPLTNDDDFEHLHEVLGYIERNS